MGVESKPCTGSARKFWDEPGNEIVSESGSGLGISISSTPTDEVGKFSDIFRSDFLSAYGIFAFASLE